MQLRINGPHHSEGDEVMVSVGVVTRIIFKIKSNMF